MRFNAQFLKKFLEKKDRFSFRKVFAWTLLLLIGVVFIFFGYSSKNSIGVGHALMVGQKAISLSQFRFKLMQTEERFRQFNLLSFLQINIKEMVLNQLIDGELSSQATEKIGISASPEALAQKIVLLIPEFRENNVFSRTKYMKIMEMNQIHPSDFEDLLRRDLNSGRMKTYFDALAGEITFLENLNREMNRLVSIVDLIRLNTSDMLKFVTVSDAELATYMTQSNTNAENKEKMESPTTIAKPETKKLAENKEEQKSKLKEKKAAALLEELNQLVISNDSDTFEKRLKSLSIKGERDQKLGLDRKNLSGIASSLDDDTLRSILVNLEKDKWIVVKGSDETRFFVRLKTVEEITPSPSTLEPKNDNLMGETSAQGMISQILLSEYTAKKRDKIKVIVNPQVMEMIKSP